MKTINDGHIGFREAIALTIIFIATKVFFAFPAAMAAKGYSAGWAVPLIGGMVAIVGWLIMVRLMERFPEKSIVEVGEEVAGPIIGGVFYLGFFAFILGWVLFQLRQFSETTITAILPETPISIITAAVLLTALYASYLGIEAISRACHLVIPFVAGALALLLLGVLPYSRLEYLFPLAGPGVIKLVKEGLVTSSVFGEILILPLLFPCFRKVKDFKKAGLISLIISIIVMSIVVLVFVTYTPYPASANITIPLYSMARLISVGRFVQRVESIFLFIWIFGALLKISLGLYILTVSTGRYLKLPVFRPLLFPMAILIFTLNFLIPDLPTTLELGNNYLTGLGWAPSLVLPLILYAIVLVRKKGGKRNEGKSSR